MSRTPLSLALPAAAVLALSACGGSDDPAGESVSAPGATTTDAPAQTPAQTPAQDPAAAPEQAAPPAGTERPPFGSCVDVPESPDGLYTVADAGTIVVTRDGDRLVLGEILPAEGWEPSVDDQEEREIEVEFRRGGEEVDIEFEVEDGGRLSVELCSDDD